MKFCECGCGEPAPIAKVTNRRAGHVKDEPMRFIRYHAARSPEVRELIALNRAAVGNPSRGGPKPYEPRPRKAPGYRRVPARDGDVKQAHDRVNGLVRRGIIPRPATLPCTDCGQVWEPGLPRHEYDHHLGYAAEHHESVEPVCSPCHHAREKSRGRVRKPRVAVIR